MCFVYLLMFSLPLQKKYHCGVKSIKVFFFFEKKIPIKRARNVKCSYVVEQIKVYELRK